MPQSPPTPPTSVTETVIPHTIPIISAAVVADDKRAYMLWREKDGSAKLSAVDLTTKKLSWPALELGNQRNDGMTVGDDFLLIVGQQVSGSAEFMLVVDPETGKQRFRLPFRSSDMEVVLFRGVIVVVDVAKRKTTAFDLSTGKQLWSSNDPVRRGGSTGWASSKALAGPAGWHWHWRVYERELVQLLTDGRARLRDPRTGTITSEFPDLPIGPSDSPFVIDGRLYLAGPQGLRLTIFLTGGKFHVPNEVRQNVYVLEPCGPDRLCMLQQRPGGATDGMADLVMLIASTGEELWRHPVPLGADAILPSGKAVQGGEFGEIRKAFALDGKVLLHTPDLGLIGWLDQDTALAAREGTDGRRVVLLAVSLDGSRRVLAEHEFIGWCGWNSTAMVCPTPDGFTLTTFSG